MFWHFFNQLKSAGKCLIKTDNKHQGYKENFQRVGIAKLEMLKIDLTVSNRASDTLTFTRPKPITKPMASTVPLHERDSHSTCWDMNRGINHTKQRIKNVAYILHYIMQQ